MFCGKFCIMMIGENRFHSRSYVLVSECIYVSYIDLNPENLGHLKWKSIRERESVSIFCRQQFSTQKLKATPYFLIFPNSLDCDLCDVENVYIIHSENKYDLLSDVWFYFFDHDLNNQHEIIESCYTFAIRWNYGIEKKKQFRYVFSLY